MPLGGPAEHWATPEEMRHIQGLYAGEAAFVDHCLGRLFQALENLGYTDDSIIFITADHGHPLGDHGKFLKGGDRMYNELLRVPFMVRLPGGKGARRSQALVQFPDLLPTLLDLLGMGNNTGSMHGHSFLPVLRGDSDEHRDAIVSGYHGAADLCIRDRTWSYVQRPEGEPDELYDLIEDPKERTNLIDEHPEQAQRLAHTFGNYFRPAAKKVEVKGIQGKYEMSSGGIA
jgi:arylsulfatase A-like enzyme